MNMKSDDLERLEELQEMQQLIRSAKEQYEREKLLCPPVSYSTFKQVIKNKSKSGKRSGISPWWLAAACLLGCVIGYGLSAVSGGHKAEPDKLAVVTDTVVVLCERVDTVYRELPKKRVHVAQRRKVVKETEPFFISIEFLQQQQNLPDPDSDCYAASGMTIAEGNYPFHLLTTIPQ
jgi:hypothetical protein